jgi:hypothetical protein
MDEFAAIGRYEHRLKTLLERGITPAGSLSSRIGASTRADPKERRIVGVIPVAFVSALSHPRHTISLIALRCGRRQGDQCRAPVRVGRYRR